MRVAVLDKKTNSAKSTEKIGVVDRLQKLRSLIVLVFTLALASIYFPKNALSAEIETNLFLFLKTKSHAWLRK